MTPNREIESGRGTARVSTSPKDPRARRNAAARAAGGDVAAPIRYDEAGRITVTPIADPGPPPTDSIEALGQWAETLYSRLRSAGYIGGS